MSMVSIVIPSHNRPDLLDRLLASIRCQTFLDFEVVVVDDASSDRAAYDRVLGRYSGDISLRYIRNRENCGAQYSRNRGVTESKGELVAFVDDDDEWLPRKLERQTAIFASATEQLGLVYAWADSVDENGLILHQYRAAYRGNVLKDLINNCFIPSPTVVVRRAALERTGGFDESLPSCQDWDMWTRIAEAGYELDVAEEVLALHHKHERASIGTSPRSPLGFYRFYGKHADLYKRMGMKNNLSEKYRGLAHLAILAGDCKLAGVALHCSVALWKGNWKAWVRLSQFLIGRVKC